MFLRGVHYINSARYMLEFNSFHLCLQKQALGLYIAISEEKY